jgi:predicted metal-binding membrane protein
VDVRHGGARSVPASFAIPAAIAIAWLLAIVAELTGTARFLHHDALIEGTLPLWEAVLLFVVAWQAMIVAMMLPSSLPLVRLFAAVSSPQRDRRVLAAFLGGYAVVWTAFGVAAFAGDVVLHHVVDATPWLGARPWLIGGAVLVLAGAFQFSPLKDRCLQKCRTPANFVMARYRRGVAAAFALGREHGLFCLGCCWALMLVMFAAGFASLWWMAALTALMTYEKTGRYGARLVPIAGAIFVIAGAILLLHPPAAPANAF